MNSSLRAPAIQELDSSTEPTPAHRAWFSPTGFRRGLILAALAAAAWAGWAVGYWQADGSALQSGPAGISLQTPGSDSVQHQHLHQHHHGDPNSGA